MRFEHPEFLFALLLAALPAALFLSRYVRSRRADFPAAWFMFGEDRRPLARLRSRQIFTTLLRTGVVLLVALAFAGPVVTGSAQQATDRAGRKTLLLFDTSASMAATAQGLSALDSSLMRALSMLESARDNELFAVLACPHPSRRLNWLSARRAEAEVRAVSQAWGSCKLAGILEHLGPLLEPSTRVVIFSDFQKSALGRDEGLLRLTGQLRVQWVQTPETGPNLSLASLSLHPAGLHAVVESHSDRPVESRLKVSCPDWETELPVATEGRGLRTFPLDTEGPLGPVVCRVHLTPDSLAQDDSLWMTLGEQREVQVLIVEGAPAAEPGISPSFFVAAALRTGRHFNVSRIAQPEFSIDNLSLADVVVMVDPRPLAPYLETALKRFAQDGGHLWLFAGNNLSGWDRQSKLLPGIDVRSCSAVEEHPFRIEWFDLADPVMREFGSLPETTLAQWTNLRHMAVSFQARTARVLARFSDSVPAISRMPMGRGEMLIWSLVPELGNGDFPLHPLFPLLTFAFIEEAAKRPPAVQLPIICPMDDRCPVAKAGGESRIFEGGASSHNTLATSAAGEVMCAEPGPYFETVREGRRLAFVCRIRPEESRLERYEPQPLAADDRATDRPGRPQRSTGYAPLLLLGALMLVFAEVILISGRRA